MHYKMSRLVELTQVPKSTILYYIKEGILPEAEKLKPNVHRYSQQHLELIRYIKYMQHGMGASISRIREILQHPDISFSSSTSMLVPLMQSLTGMSKDQPLYEKDAFLEACGIDAALLEKLIKDEIIIPLAQMRFGSKELSMVRLVKAYIDMGLEYDILYRYLYHAKMMAELEGELQQSLCGLDVERDHFEQLWKILFDTVFTAKPYLQQRQTQLVFSQILDTEMC